MVRIQKYVIFLVFGAFRVNYAMNVEDDTPVILPEAVEGWQTPSSSDTSSSLVDSDPYCYTHSVTNPDTGSTLIVEVATDGHDWGVGLSYNRVGQDSYEDRSSSASESKETSDAYNVHQGSSTHDSYADSVLDSNIRNDDYWQKQRQAEGDGPTTSIKSEEDSPPLPDRTY